MTGPRDQDLDAGIFDDQLHEYEFGFPLLWREGLDNNRDELVGEPDCEED